MSGSGMNMWPGMYLHPGRVPHAGAVQGQVPYGAGVPQQPPPPQPPPGACESLRDGAGVGDAHNDSSHSSGKRSAAERMEDLRARNKVAQARYRARKRQAAQAALAEHARLAAELDALRNENAALTQMVDARERMLATCDESLKLLRTAADAEAAQSPAPDLSSLRSRQPSGAGASPSFGARRAGALRFPDDHGRAAWHLVERCYASEGLRGAPGISQGALDRARGALVQAWAGGVQGTPWASRHGGEKEAVDRLKTVLIGVREAERGPDRLDGHEAGERRGEGAAAGGGAAGPRGAAPGAPPASAGASVPGAFPPSLEDPLAALEALEDALDDSWATRLAQSGFPRPESGGTSGGRDWQTVISERGGKNAAATSAPPPSLPPTLTKLLRDLALRRDIMRTFEEDTRLMPGQIAAVSTCQGMLAAMVEAMEADGWGVWTDADDRADAAAPVASICSPPLQGRAPPVRLLIQWLDAGLIDAPDAVVSRAWFEHASRVREALKYLRRRAEDAEAHEAALGADRAPGEAPPDARRAAGCVSPRSRRMHFDRAPVERGSVEPEPFERGLGNARWKELGSSDEVSSAGGSARAPAGSDGPAASSEARGGAVCVEAKGNGVEKGAEAAAVEGAIGAGAAATAAAVAPGAGGGTATSGIAPSAGVASAVGDAAPSSAPDMASPLCMDEGVPLSELPDDVILGAEVGERIDSATSLPISLTLHFSMDDAAGRDTSFSMPDPSPMSQSLLAALRSPEGSAKGEGSGGLEREGAAGAPAPGLPTDPTRPRSRVASASDPSSAPRASRAGSHDSPLAGPGSGSATSPAPAPATSVPPAGRPPLAREGEDGVEADSPASAGVSARLSRAASCCGEGSPADASRPRQPWSSSADPSFTRPRPPRISSALPSDRACDPTGIPAPLSPLRPSTPPGVATADPSVTPAIVHVLCDTPELLQTPSSALEAREQLNVWIENQFRDICALLNTLACYRPSLAVGLHNGGVAPSEPPSEALDQWRRMAKAMRIERWQAAHLRRVLSSLVRRQAALRAERARLVAALLVLRSDQVSLRTSASDALAWRAVLDALDSCKRRELSDLGAFHVNGFAPFRPDQILEPLLLSWPHLFDCIHMAQALLEEATSLYGDQY